MRVAVGLFFNGGSTADCASADNGLGLRKINSGYAAAINFSHRQPFGGSARFVATPQHVTGYKKWIHMA
jgi:hypothetical protein